MNDHNIQLQIFYELAMAIGNSLDLDTMLKESLQAYLRKLDFSAGIVFQAIKNQNGNHDYKQIFSIPYRIQKNATYQTALKMIPENLPPEQWKLFPESLPLTGSVPDYHSYCIMALPGFGLILFIFSEDKLPKQLMKSLEPINSKLAIACNACLSNKRMTAEIERRKQSEQTALESKKRLGKIFETVQAGIMIVDVETRKIIAANTSALEMIGGTREKILGKPCHEYICPAGTWQCPMLDIQQSVNNSEKYLVTLSGEHIPILKSITRIELSGRQCLLESFIDLRRLKKAEEERDFIKRKLMHAQKLESLGRLSGGIAHDFNNILYAASGYTEMAMEDVAEESLAAGCLENIKLAHKRAADLIKQILAFSRTDTEERKAIRIQPVLEEAIKLIRNTIPANIEIHKDIDKDCGPILADETRIHQIIINLCTNAHHAMRKKGGIMDIRLSTIAISNDPVIRSIDLSPGDYIRLTVSDTGKGMDEETKKRIFEPFFTTKEVGLGTGMGLSTVHGIVKSYGGGIHVSSELLKGSSFHVYLPGCMEEIDAGQPENMTRPLEGKETILFVDDDADIARLIKMTLERSGYTIHSFTCSDKAFKAFLDSPYLFELVITDMNMPKLTGIELAEKMMVIRPDIPILLCTGYSEATTREKVLEMGLVNLIHKPTSKEDLLMAIRNALDDKKDTSQANQCL